MTFGILLFCEHYSQWKYCWRFLDNVQTSNNQGFNLRKCDLGYRYCNNNNNNNNSNNSNIRDGLHLQLLLVSIMILNRECP